MPYGMYISAAGAQMQAQRMEVIANNLANVNTPGFKRDEATFQARFAEAIERGSDQPGTGSVNDIGGGVALASVQSDFSPGALKHTGVPTDIAIDGDGFFSVQKGEETYLTRAGNFRLTSEGDLVTTDGYSVLSDGGAPIAIRPEQGPWSVTKDGAITQAGNTTYLSITRPASTNDLVKVGQNLFRPQAELQSVPLPERRVLQNVVESSGVNATSEMMTLIETSRAFEANTKLIQHQDQMISSLISRVLQS